MQVLKRGLIIDAYNSVSFGRSGYPSSMKWTYDFVGDLEITDILSTGIVYKMKNAHIEIRYGIAPFVATNLTFTVFIHNYGVEVPVYDNYTIYITNSSIRQINLPDVENVFVPYDMSDSVVSIQRYFVATPSESSFEPDTAQTYTSDLYVNEPSVYFNGEQVDDIYYNGTQANTINYNGTPL